MNLRPGNAASVSPHPPAMSHNYPYRRSDTDLRPDPGPYSSADRQHQSSDFYRPQECVSYPSSSSSSSSRAASQDGVVSILSSCGLEPEDLGLLAELPEDVLTVESLPHILKQIKSKRGTVKPFPSSAPSSSSSYPTGSTHRPPSSFDQFHNQPVQYPLHLIPSTSLPSNQDHRDSSRTRRADAPSSSSSGFSVGYQHRAGPSDYGKTGPGPSFSPAEQGSRARPSRHSEAQRPDSRAAPPPTAKPQEGRRESGSSSSRSVRPSASTPVMKQALDFHGTTPPAYPYSCSLCQITVLSERVWIQHINGTLHADGQLSLLQQFPNWDCRMETVSREDDQSEKRRDNKKPSPPQQTSNQSQTSQTNQKLPKTADKGKVVCVKFPAESVDETYLRKLTEPFGKILKILMFPSLAFLELGTVDQAKDLVKFHVNYPPTVNGENIEFSISNTFSFLQSSQVVSFSPAPAGEDGRSDLLSIVKRFGLPLYTLFLPSTSFVEMKNVLDAQKLVDYYSTNTLRINGDSIKVSFSGEFKSLMKVPSAKRYEEEPRSAKRARSSSREKDEKSGTKRTRRESSRDRKTRSRSRERSSRHRRSRSRSRDKSSSTSSRKNRSRSRDKSSRNRRTRTKSRSRSKDKSRTRSRSKDKSRTRSRSKDKSRTKSSRETRSKSREKSNREKKSRSKSREKTSKEKPGSSDKSSTGSSGKKTVESESRSEDDPASLSASKPEAADTEQTEEEAEVSAEESDIEGMEVIAEDGQDLEEEEEEEEEEEAAEEKDSPQSLEQDETDEKTEDKVEEEDGCGMKKEESEETAETQEDEEPDFPVDLENCITLDELDEDKSDEDDRVQDDPKPVQSSRVLCFTNLPPQFPTSEFLSLVRDFGTAVRYILIHGQQESFIEMSSSSEASKAARELTLKPPIIFNNFKPIVCLSYKYHRLSNGTCVPLDKGSSRRSNRRSPSRRSISRTSDQDEADKRLKRKESSKKSAEKESASEKTIEQSTPEKTPEEDSTSRKTPENESLNKKVKKRTSKTHQRRMMLAETRQRRKQVQKARPKREETPEDDSVSQETLKAESAKDEKDLEIKQEPEDDQLEEKLSEAEEPRDEEKTTEVCLESETSESEVKDSESPNPPVDTGDGPKPQPEQNDDAAAETERRPEPEKSAKPVGTEFVRPVVGYFCNLCQLIFADEDEAKQQHCSSPTHYSRYQGQTGKDPWTS
ncbi:LOW QUALITY PROTEIN: matrin-3-like [Acanthochromis polyacanthus]|uniref:LOW QUALITY PROTEIN: matrin-3-like n=1 Tax=Acanthochromis polyacanthus TaxID=80966 RepID=UPI002234D0A1|nr:LOW QUALITY PROTEIN: matrin-3-like [Acanthochromis polyacanthus]